MMEVSSLRTRVMSWGVTIWLGERARRDDGQAAIEYGVLAVLILAAAIAFIPGIGTWVSAAFSKLSSAIP
jgi:Flp pilus assembly pilin Flp